MTSSKQATKDPIYQIKVTLKDSEPRIWRRFQVKGNTTLYKLHQILQVVMGWESDHLYEFVIGETHYGELEDDLGFGLEVKDAKRVKLSQVVAGEKTKFTYVYDFGDDWRHEVLIEKILPPEVGVHYPVCIKGKNACPPEDCGGIWGYYDVLEAVQNPNDKEHDELREWLGDDFVPEAFDLNKINRELKSIIK